MRAISAATKRPPITMRETTRAIAEKRDPLGLLSMMGEVYRVPLHFRLFIT
jgi:hypothetical protein